MRATALLPLAALVACAHAATAVTAAAPPRPPALRDLGWLTGAWQAGAQLSRWQPMAGAIYGVILGDGTFEVDIVDDSDDDGHPAPIALTTLRDGQGGERYALVAATPMMIELSDGAGKLVRFRRTADGVRDERDAQPPRHPTLVAATPAGVVATPAVEDADRAFAAATAAHGVDGWVAAFAPSGAQWAGGHRVEGPAAIRAHITPTLASGALAWTPRTSGARGDLGFTLGEWTFTPATGAAARGSYCTIWRRAAAGTWQVVFDVGRPADAP
jgi:ketosteroid isomerase-like protein